MRSVFVIVNAGSGGGTADGAALLERLGALFGAAGAAVELRLVHDGHELAETLRVAVARRPDVIAAGGGDGTIGSVAAAVAGTAMALGVLPLGTLNHFAKDMQLPLELEAAVALIAGGALRRVDVGEVNGRIFVNNSSLGLYPDLVRDRERQQHRLGRGKWVALAWASLTALRRLSFMRVRLAIEGGERERRTPFVFIGNNAYAMEGFAIGRRHRLDAGQLSLYVAQRAGRWRLVQLAVRALVGRLRQARDFEATLAREIVVESRHRRLRVAIDGEVVTMTPPLVYRSRPGVLAVVTGGTSD